jgi:hypothetical protein
MIAVIMLQDCIVIEQSHDCVHERFELKETSIPFKFDEHCVEFEEKEEVPHAQYVSNLAENTEAKIKREKVIFKGRFNDGDGV